MSIYSGKTQLSYHLQSHLHHTEGIKPILDMNLSNLGVDLLKKVYDDHPEYFTQREMREFQVTEYKVELAIISKDEYLQLKTAIDSLRSARR